VSGARWAEVRAWRDRLRSVDAAACDTGLSPEGAREALSAALDALDDRSLAEVGAMEGRPFQRGVFVAASTVVTAPIEWLAVLLGRGTEVVLKHPSAHAGLAPALRDAATAVGLPLAITTDRSVVVDGDLVVVMGNDATISAIRAGVQPHTRVLANGHRFSAAWVTGAPLPVDPRVPADFQDTWGRVAADAALHDGRGCFSPLAVFTPLSLDEACVSLSRAMDRAAARWPIGFVAPAEAAAIRSRRVLAVVTGAMSDGPGGSAHGLPPLHWSPAALPRSVAVVSVPSPEAAASLLAPHAAALSTVGTDDPAAASAFVEVGALRVCTIGRMQRPPLIRPHDGREWLAATRIAISDEV
jgi:hypothetical protein